MDGGKSKPLITINDFIAGSFAGMVQVLLGQPFDIIKVRMQTQSSLYGSMMDCVKKTYVNEGILAFYKGTLSPLIGISACVSIQFSSNEFAKRLRLRRQKQRNSTSNLTRTDFILCGAFSGVCNSFAITPVELIRIKLQVQGNSKANKYSGSVDCFRKIVSENGIKGLYQGLVITILRELPAYMIYFGSYETLMQISEKKYGNRSNIPITNIMTYGAIAGMLLWIGTFPIDVLKSIIQSQEFNKKKTVPQVFIDLYRSQGMKGFFNGLAPCLMRAPPINAATFLAFETVMGFLKNKN